MGHSEYDPGIKDQREWNAGRKTGAKRALKPQQVWAIRFWLDQERRLRDHAMFDFPWAIECFRHHPVMKHPAPRRPGAP